MGPKRTLVWVSLALTLLVQAADARAWTQTQIRSVRAKVVFEGDGSALVTLTTHLRVHSGMIRELELAGLDTPLSYQAHPEPVFLSSRGQRYRPSVEPEESGRILLRFDWGKGPPRGDYSVRVRYRTQLGPEVIQETNAGDYRVAWTLPGWDHGLTDVAIEVHAPLGTNMLEPASAELEHIEVQSKEDQEHSVLLWKRAHLARTLPWTIEFEVPRAHFFAKASAAPLNAEEQTPQATDKTLLVAPPAQADPDALPQLPWLFSLLLIAVICLKIWSWNQATRSRDLIPQALIPLKPRHAIILAITLCCIASLVWLHSVLATWALWLSASALAYQRVPRPLRPKTEGAWALALGSRTDLKPTAPPLSHALFDATTWPGLLLLGCFALLIKGTPLLGSLPSLPSLGLIITLFFSGTRFQWPTAAQERLSLLKDYIRSLRIDLEKQPFSFTPLYYVAETQEVIDARMRIESMKRRPGLLRLDFFVDDLREGLISRPHVHLLIVTRDASPASDVLRRRLGKHWNARRLGSQIATVLKWNPKTGALVNALCTDAPDHFVPRRAKKEGSWRKGKASSSRSKKTKQAA